MDATRGDGQNRLQTLVDSLECVTEADLCLLADAKQSTLDAWRKRGTGPAYVRIGNRVLYPRQAVAEHLKRLTHERAAPQGRSLL